MIRKRAETKSIQIKGPQKEYEVNDEESGCRGYTDQGHAIGVES